MNSSTSSSSSSAPDAPGAPSAPGASDASSASGAGAFFARYLGPLLLFTVAFALGLDAFFMRVVLPATTTSGAGKLHRLFHELHPDEVPIFGSSRAEGNFTPSLLGEHVFDYGLPGIESDVVEVFLGAELDKPKKTPILLNFDADYFGEQGIGDINTLLPFCETPGLAPLLEDKNPRVAYCRIPGVRLYGGYEYYFKNYLGRLGSPTRVHDHGSASEIDELPPELFAEAVRLRSKGHMPFALDPARDRRFQALLSRAGERRIVVIMAPYHYCYEDTFAGMPDLIAYFDALSRNHPNVTTLRFSGHGYEDALWFDTTHLNARGARRFSLELRAKLDALGLSL